jgi:pyruvate/2-oxoglutarate dehydrogenase complex dihydrolipoamide dehydrogenase (E3) component
MPSAETYDILVIGSGESGKYLAWTMAGEGHRIPRPQFSRAGSLVRIPSQEIPCPPCHQDDHARCISRPSPPAQRDTPSAVVERKLIGGSCPNIACLPSKNIIQSAKVRSFTRRAAEFGVDLESAATNMKGVQARKRAMVDSLREVHLGRYRASGAELIMGEARFSGERTVDVELTDGGRRQIRGERVFLNLGTRATMPDVPGLADARPMTNIELLDLDRLPGHLIVIGGGYIGLELAQAMGRFGAQVTVIEAGPQPLGHEDPDVTAGIVGLFGDEGITLHRQSMVRSVDGESGRSVRVVADGPDGELTIDGTDHRPGAGRRAADRDRLHRRRRAPGHHRGRRLGDGGLRRQPSVHPRGLR